MLSFGVVTLMPEMFNSLSFGITKRAIENKIVNISYFNPRDWANNSYKKVDDKPYGGGPGMVLMYEPLKQAILAAKNKLSDSCKTIYLSPQGKRVTQQKLQKVATKDQSILFIAGRYEGIDERIIENYVDEQWSLGDFVLSGGEFAAMAFIDAIVRLLPGSLGDDDSIKEESFMDGLLEYPQYSRPATIDGHDIPQVLLRGNHSEILRWRRKQSLGRTWLQRPDLMKNLILNDLDEQLLREFRNECNEEQS